MARGDGGSKWVCLLDGVSPSGKEKESGARKEIQRDQEEKKKRFGVEWRAVIFIKNVPRGSDASYEIVATNSREITSAPA